MVSRFSSKRILLLSCVAFLSVGLALAQGGAINQAKQSFPISLGTSGGNVHDISRRFCCSGTLGALVTKNGVDYILSNNHILADSDTASVGDDVSQPGLVDVGCNAANANVVANFSEAPILGTANVDAALAQIVSGAVQLTGDILELGIPSSTPATPAINMGVAKSGRTTGLTCASIASLSVNVRVRYQTGCGKGRKFSIIYLNQVLVNGSSFSAAGDSGSLIVDSSTAQPVALLFAGSSTVTLANPISDATTALGVSFVGGGNRSVACPAAAAASQTAALQSPQSASMGRALLAKERHADRLMQDEAVLGVGVGADPENPSEAAVVIYLEQGRMHAPLPEELDGVRVRVIRTDAIQAYGWNEHAVAPCRAF